MTEDILNQIDHAIGDWTVSGDAMRCTPEPQEEVFAVSEEIRAAIERALMMNLDTAVLYGTQRILDR